MAKDTKKAAAKAEKKEPRRGVGTVAREAIAAGRTNEETLAIVKKEFPGAKTSLAAINWYRNKMRGDGEKIPTARELKKKNAPAAAPKAAKAAAPKANGKGARAADPTA